jgi:hypothetical protein
MKKSELRQLIREEVSKTLNENFSFDQVEDNREYYATMDFGIFRKGETVFVDTVRNIGSEIVLILVNQEGKVDSIKGDLIDPVEVFH